MAEVHTFQRPDKRRFSWPRAYSSKRPDLNQSKTFRGSCLVHSNEAGKYAEASSSKQAAQAKPKACSACFVPVIRKTQKQPEFYVEP